MNYSDAALEKLMIDIESDLAERKESWNGDAPDKARQAVCAFANDLPDHRKPGVLFIGANNKGHPTGLAITDELLQTLSDLKTDGNILPPPSIIVQKRLLKGKDVAVVMVQPADAPPVRYKGRIWIRTGPRRDIATAQDERMLNEKRRFRDPTFEMRPIPSAGLEEIDRILFTRRYLPNAFAREAIDKDDRSFEQQLSVCGMIDAAENPVPTGLGLIVLGRRPRFFIGGDYIQFLRINGSQISDPITDEALIDGDLAQIDRRIDEKLQSHNRVSIDIISQRVEKRKYLYPEAALQQIVRNALMHRTYENTNAPIHVYWYNNRIEIFSPGGPFGAVNSANFGKPGIVDYRNPHIADAMKVFGLVQRFGIGIQTAQMEMARNGNPPIEFKIDSSSVICILRNAPVSAPVSAPNTTAIPKIQQNILKEIRQNPNLSYNELATLLKRDRSTIMRNIQKLKEIGIIQRIGSDKTGKWAVKA